MTSTYIWARYFPYLISLGLMGKTREKLNRYIKKHPEYTNETELKKNNMWMYLDESKYSALHKSITQMYFSSMYARKYAYTKKTENKQ